MPAKKRKQLDQTKAKAAEVEAGAPAQAVVESPAALTTPPAIPATQAVGVQRPTAARSAEKIGLKEYEAELARLYIEPVKLQEWVKSMGLRVAVIFEGRDAAGKGWLRHQAVLGVCEAAPGGPHPLVDAPVPLPIDSLLSLQDEGGAVRRRFPCGTYGNNHGRVPSPPRRAAHQACRGRTRLVQWTRSGALRSVAEQRRLQRGVGRQRAYDLSSFSQRIAFINSSAERVLSTRNPDRIML